jgi:hypothetical protein
VRFAITGAIGAELDDFVFDFSNGLAEGPAESLAAARVIGCSAALVLRARATADFATFGALFAAVVVAFVGDFPVRTLVDRRLGVAPRDIDFLLEAERREVDFAMSNTQRMRPSPVIPTTIR